MKNNIDIKVTQLNDGVLVDLKPIKGFRQDSNKYRIAFFNNDTKELIFEEKNAKAGWFSKCMRRDIDILVQVETGRKIIHQEEVKKVIVDLSHMVRPFDEEDEQTKLWFEYKKRMGEKVE